MIKFLFDSDTWQEIFESIRRNKFRTAVTIFGVMWGVFLLVSLLGLARGVKNGFNHSIGGFAMNSVFIWTQSTSKAFKGYQKGRRVELTLHDIEAVKKQIKGIQYVVPRNIRTVQVTHEFRSVNEGVYGDYPLLDKVQKKKLVDGRFINQTDIEKRRKVCVLEEMIYKQLFDEDEDPIGQYLVINNINFRIVGMYKKDNMGGGPQGGIHIPFSTFRQVFNTGDRIGWIMITGKPEYDIAQIESDTKLLLKTLHGVHPEDNKAFGSFNLGEMFQKATGFIYGIEFLTWFVGIATLIAGVFAIGNILLIIVKERTGEIGVRRALGATPWEIKRQIILESVFLTSLAGSLGIIMGGLTLYIVDRFFSSDFLLNPTVSIPVILLAVLILVTLGTLIGLIPAQIATQKKPIDALREE
jgi:putative ABC transport system permease protein